MLYHLYSSRMVSTSACLELCSQSRPQDQMRSLGNEINEGVAKPNNRVSPTPLFELCLDITVLTECSRRTIRQQDHQE